MSTNLLKVPNGIEGPVKQKAIAECVLLRPGAVVWAWWARTVGNIAWPFNTGKVVHYVEDDIGGMVAEGRNQIVAHILEMSERNPTTEIDKIFWMDDDVLPISPLILRALDSHIHKSPIVSGVYFSKEEYAQPLIFPEKGHGVGTFEPDKAIEAWACGMGLTLVKVDLYRQMRDELKLPMDAKGNPEWYRTKGRNVDLVRDEGKFLDLGGTEDLYFCDLAAKLGVRPIIDMGKHAFGFHYSLATKQAFPTKQWEQFRKNKPIVWDTAHGPVEWS